MARRFLDPVAWSRSPAVVDGQGRFLRGLLVDPRGREPGARFVARLFKGNVEPTGPLTVSHRGTAKCRSRADGSGFANLFLDGDWIDNGARRRLLRGLRDGRDAVHPRGDGPDIRVRPENLRLRPAGHRSSGDLADRVRRGR